MNFKEFSQDNISTICYNKWLSLKKIQYNNQDYIFSHEERCNGNIVVILPYRISSNFEYLLCSEVTPCWHKSNNIICSITGGNDKGETPKQSAVKELLEEAGYEVSENDLIDLGTCRGTKSTDTIYHLFSVNLSDKKQLIPTDKINNPKLSSFCFWTPNISISEDPFVYVLFYKLKKFLEKE